jgi:hypothetical protein
MEEKIQKAKEYVAIVGRNADWEVHMCIRNDAANIFADSYEEYMAIYEALRKGWASLYRTKVR